MATGPGLKRKKKQNKKQNIESFFPLNFNVYINLDNRERTRVKEKKKKNGHQFRWKKNMMKII